MMDNNKSHQPSCGHRGKATLLATVSLLGASLGVTTSADAQYAKVHVEYKPQTSDGSKAVNAPNAMRHAKQPPVLKPSGSTTLNAATGPSKSLTQPNSILGTGGVPAVTSGAKTGNSGTAKR